MNTSSFIKRVLLHSELLGKVVAACHDFLNYDMAKTTTQYVRSRISKNSIDKFRFGHFPQDGNDLDVLIEKVRIDSLKALGLVYPDRENQAILRSTLSNHNLIIPIIDDYDNIVALVGRTFLSEEDQKKAELQKYKYTNRYRKSGNLFGLSCSKRAIRNKNSVIVVEGQIDCVSCHSYGLHNTVALGGSSMSDYQMYLLMKYSKSLTVNLLLDNDDAGRKGQQKIIDKFSSSVKINKIYLPDQYKDVDEYLRKSETHSVLDKCL